MKKATSSEETYDVKKKQPVLRKHMRWKREKRSNIVRIDILSQFFLYIQSDVFFHQMMMFSINKGKYLGKQKFGWELILDWWFRICSFRGIDSTGEHNYVKHIGQSFDFFVSFVTPIYSRRNNQSKSCFFVQLWQMLLPHNTALLKNDYFSLCF